MLTSSNGDVIIITEKTVGLVAYADIVLIFKDTMSDWELDGFGEIMSELTLEVVKCE